MRGFVMNPAFIPALARSAGVVAVVKARTERVFEEWQRIAPVFTGHYLSGGRVEISVEGGRVIGRVIVDDPTGAAGLIEFGTEDTPAFAPLRRALQAVFGAMAKGPSS